MPIFAVPPGCAPLKGVDTNVTIVNLNYKKVIIDEEGGDEVAM